MSSDSELGELLQGFRVAYLKINAKKKLPYQAARCV